MNLAKCMLLYLLNAIANSIVKSTTDSAELLTSVIQDPLGLIF